MINTVWRQIFEEHNITKLAFYNLLRKLCLQITSAAFVLCKMADGKLSCARSAPRFAMYFSVLFICPYDSFFDLEVCSLCMCFTSAFLAEIEEDGMSW